MASAVALAGVLICVPTSISATATACAKNHFFVNARCAIEDHLARASDVI